MLPPPHPPLWARQRRQMATGTRVMYLRYFRLFRDSVLVMKGMAMIRGWVRDGPRSICQRIQVCSLGLTRGEYMLYG